MARAILVVSLLACAACGVDGGGSETGATVVAPCHVGGCSSEICSDTANVAGVCSWLPEFACYRNATCEPQADGSCGWTQTRALVACIRGVR